MPSKVRVRSHATGGAVSNRNGWLSWDHGCWMLILEKFLMQKNANVKHSLLYVPGPHPTLVQISYTLHFVSLFPLMNEATVESEVEVTNQ